MHRKFFDHHPGQARSILKGALLSVLLSASPVDAQSPPGSTPSPTPQEQKVDPRPFVEATEWKGIVARPSEIRRLPGDLLQCSFDFINLPTSPAPVLMATNIRKVMRPGVDGRPATEEIEYDPYDISDGASITDESTGITYAMDKAATGELATPLVSNTFFLRPGSGSSMSVILKCPPALPVVPGKPAPKQTVTIKIPRLNEVFREIPLPREAGDVVRFSR